MALQMLLLTGVILAPSARGEGGPPMITDDPGTTPAGHWQLIPSFQTDLRPSQNTFLAPDLEIDYGVSEHWELKYEVGWILLKNHGQSTINGLGNSLAGFKWRFLDEDHAGISMSTAPQLEFNNPTGSVHRGLVKGGTTLLLPVNFSKDFGSFSVGGEAGYRFIQHEKDAILYGLIVGKQLGKQVQVMAELHGSTDQDFRSNDLIVNVGTRVQCTEAVSLMLSGGRSLRSSNNSSRFVSFVGVVFGI